MAAIAIQDVPAAGLASVTFAAANSGGDTVAYGSKSLAGYEQYSVILIARNTNAATKDVTVGGVTVTCPATTGVSIVPVPNEGLNDASVAVTYSDTTNVTVAAVRILP